MSILRIYLSGRFETHRTLTTQYGKARLPDIRLDIYLVRMYTVFKLRFCRCFIYPRLFG